MKSDAEKAFSHFFEIIKILRGEGGCPWDIAQTPQTMKSHLLEETYEAIDAIEECESSNNEKEHVKEELGDVILNAIMIAYMYEQAKDFSVEDVFVFVSEKLIRRHPHIFGSEEDRKKNLSAEGVLQQWKKIKQTVEKKENDETQASILDGISFKSPILKAIKLKECVAKVGFDWDDANGVMAKVDEEVEEIKMAIKNKDEENTEEEIGDALFVLVNLADKLKINPELALNKANKKFERRFRAVEEKMKKACIPLKKENLAQMEAFWQEVKKGEHDRDSNL